MHDYEDPPLGDLPFKEGDMIDVVEFIGEDWGRGWLRGKEGLFPLSFVAELEEVPPSPGDYFIVFITVIVITSTNASQTHVA